MKLKIDLRISSLINISLILLMLSVMLLIASGASYAASVPSASGQVNSADGAILRKSASTSSKQIATLADDTVLTISKEVFKKKTSTAKKNKWYYVTVNGQKGYIRADLVDNISYGSVAGKTSTKVNYRKGAGVKMKYMGKFKKNTEVTVVLKANPVSSTKGSSKTWYKVLSGDKYYYVCSSKVKITGAASSASYMYTGYSGVSVQSMTDAQFESYLSDQGFPESYKKKLRTLHKAHPNWGFVGYQTGIGWSDALAKQTKNKVSLVYKSYPSSYRRGSNQIESGWYNATGSVVAYYMDPRNFLNEDSIYMFEDLSYKPAYQTSAVVGAILAPSKLPVYGFTASIFVNAGAINNVSPVFLAARARQETGNGSDAITGKTALGAVYNPFNIGAFGGTNPLYNGLLYALAKGWNTPQKAVEGGAHELAKNYINQGQYTTYYQRFNVRNGASKVGTHQYMTNIMAPYSEAVSTKKSYASYGMTMQPLVFEIPIYSSMPSSTKLP